LTTLTKVFVILVCLFAFIFTPMAIQFAARTHNWRETAQGWRELAESAYANERSVLAVATSEMQRYKDLRDEEHNRLLNAQQRLTELEANITDLTEERDQLAGSRDNWERSARLLTAQLQLESAQNAELQQAQEKSLKEELQLRADNIALSDRVRELTAQLVIRRQQLEQTLAEIASIREENTRLREQANIGRASERTAAGPTPSARAETPVATSPIRAEVVEVSGPRVTISAGGASGVKEGMVMVIRRGGDWIGDIEMTNISPNESVGRIVNESGKRVQQNDEVIDEASFERGL